MHTRTIAAVTACLVVLAPSQRAAAAVFDRAEVSRVFNQVTLNDPASGRRPAEVRDVVVGNVSVQTGLQSRAELRFPDNTLTRLASNTVFSFRGGTRQMDLRNGAILFQVPPGSGGAQIHTAAITASITGTTGFLERIGNVYKLIVLEGEVRAFLRDRVGESIIVRGGQMLIAPLNSKSVRDWQTVDVDVNKLVKTSVLLSPKYFGRLPNQALADINRVVSAQQDDINDGRLNRTNLVIDGGVSQVIMVNNDTRNRNDTGTTTQPGGGGGVPQPLPIVTPAPIDNDPVGPGPRPTPNPNPTPAPTPPPGPTATPTPGPTATPGAITQPDPYIISRSTTITTGPSGQLPRITTNNQTNNGRIYRGNAIDGSASRFVFGSTSNFDLVSNFDQRFGQNFEPDFAPNGVAVFEFRSLRLAGPPTINNNGGPLDIALVANRSTSDPAIQSTGPGGNWDLSGLRSLFLGTADSSILLDNTIGFFATGSAFQYLQLYARGANSDVLFGAATRLTRNLYIDAERDVVLGQTADVMARDVYLNARRDVFVGGATESVFMQIAAGRAILFEGNTRAGTLFAFGEAAQVNGTLVADRLEFQLSGAFVNGASGSRITPRQFVVNADSFFLNSDEAQGTVLDTTALQNFDVNVRTLDLLSNFTIPAGALANLTVRTNIADANRNLLGFNSITTLGTGQDSLRDLGARTFVGGGDLLIRRDLQADFVTVAGDLDVRRDLMPYSTDASLLRIVTADRIALDRGISFAGVNGTANPATPPGDGFSLELHASEILFSDRRGMPDPDLFAIAGANLDGGDAAPPTSVAGGNGGTLNIGSDAAPITGNVELAAPISATTGRNATDLDFGGRGGSVNVVANGTITASSDITVSGKSQLRRSARGGNVRMTSRRLSGTAIRVASTAQIASLLAASAPGPGGEVVFRSAGGDIDISGTVTADRGRVEIENAGANGRINLSNATISADVVRARAFGENGVLTVGGGTISADTTLKLYADGSNGTVLFNGNVRLDGNSTKIITGNTVTIAPGVVVTIGGPAPAQVYTNNPNYTGSGGNGTSSGRFGGSGATTQPRAAAPGY